MSPRQRVRRGVMVAPTVPGISEAQWQANVLRLADLGAWTSYHTHDSRRSRKGFPDLVLIRPGEMLVAELKTDTGRLTPEQEQWLYLFATAGVETQVWRPRDLAAVTARLHQHPSPMTAAPPIRPLEETP